MSVCMVCGQPRSARESDPHGQFGHHDYVAKQDEAPDLHEAALRAGIWSVIEARAKELQDQAKAELAALEVGDTVAGKVDGHVVAKATKTKGRERITVTDAAAFLDWVKRFHPTELVVSVNPAYVRSLKIVDGVVIDNLGQVPSGVDVEQGDPYITIRKDPDALAVVAELLSQGRLSMDGVKALEAP